MLEIKPGMYWTICCVLDLARITDEDDLEVIRDYMDECGARVWPDLESAIAALRRDDWGPDELEAVASLRNT